MITVSFSTSKVPYVDNTCYRWVKCRLSLH